MEITAEISADTVREASALLEQAAGYVRAGWCQHAVASDALGRVVEPCAERAFAWSLAGALVAALGPTPESRPDALNALRPALAALAEVIPEPSLARWNDAHGRSQHDVAATLEQAARRCRGRFFADVAHAPRHLLKWLPDD